MSDLTPITRKESIIAGENLDPVTREEWFLKHYGGGGGGGSSSVAFIRGTKSTDNSTVTLEKSYTEIKAMIESGVLPVIVVNGLPYGDDCYYELTRKRDSSDAVISFDFVGNFVWYYASNHTINSTHYTLNLSSGNTATVNNTGWSVPKTLSGTLAAGETTLTLSDAFITTTSMIDVYTDVYGVNPTDISVSTGSITLTFEAQSNAVNVKVRVS